MNLKREAGVVYFASLPWSRLPSNWGQYSPSISGHYAASATLYLFY
jgi:hypothetical protein